MIRKALRRANRSYVFISILVLLFGAGYVGSTFAYFDGTTVDTATYAGGTLAAPVLVTALPAGYGATLSWTPAATTSGLTAEAIYGFDNGSTSSCGTPTYTSLVTGVTSTLASTTQTGPTSQNGHYYCYEIRSTHNNWYAAADFAGIQVGFIPISVTKANGNNTNTIQNTDKVTVVYNQNVALASASITVMACGAASGAAKVLLGASSCGGSPSIGAITGLTITSTSTKTYTSSAVSGGGTKTVVVTLAGGGNGNQSNLPVSGTGSFVPSGLEVTSSVAGATVYTGTTITPGGGW
ncbi:MAG TPA: hypothetical protein VGU02_02895 [Gaiellaceae bacterium]|nr:hypothetical protein [Gaiellaceae bacterium]